MPFFTICIPTYNRGYIIARALDSIKNQRFKSYEVLVIDDGSKDETETIVTRWIFQNLGEGTYKYIKKENGGKHSALNKALDIAKGDFFIILDSDDWFSENALESMAKMCEKIRKDDTFCGIMGRMKENSKDIEGNLFDLRNPVSSYFDFHFRISKTPGKRFNCVEANKTILLRQYRYPEEKDMKFVPEAWLFDQIGIKYKLLLTNDVYQYSEYLSDGMNADKEFKIRHNKGFLYHYISRIENVLPNMKTSTIVSIKIKAIAWLQYWNCVKVDKTNNKGKGPRVKAISAFGKFMRCLYPVTVLIAQKKFDR